MPEQAYQTKRDLLRAELAVPFSGYHNPAKDLILGLRRTYLKHGVAPEDAMRAWLDGKQPPGMKRLPVPEVDDRSRALFHRLVAERDLVRAGIAAGGPSVVGDENWRPRALESRLTEALHLVAIQMVDPWWAYGPNLVDIPWPNQIDADFMANGPNGHFYAATWAARSNMSYLVIFAFDEYIPPSMKTAPAPVAAVEEMSPAPGMR